MGPWSRRFSLGFLLVWVLACAADSAVGQDLVGAVARREFNEAFSRAVALSQKGDSAQAAEVGEVLLRHAEDKFGPRHPDTATALVFLGSMHLISGDADKAAQRLEQALEIRERVFGPDHTKVEEILQTLAKAYELGGAGERSAERLGRLVAVRARRLGENHPDTLDAQDRLADLHVARGDYARAAALYQRSALTQDKAGAGTVSDAVRSLRRLAAVRQAQGNSPEAARLLGQALAQAEAGSAQEPLLPAAVLQDIADQRRRAGDLLGVQETLEKALAIRERHLGPDHKDVAGTLLRLAELHREAGNYARVEPLYKRAQAALEKSLGPDHPDTALAVTSFGQYYMDLGQYALAEQLFARSLAVIEARGDSRSQAVALSAGNLGRFYVALGQPDKAGPLLKRSLAAWEAALGPTHPHTASALDALAGFQAGQGDRAAAESSYRRALAIREKSAGASSAALAATLNNLANLCDRDGRREEAERLYERALGLRESAFGAGHSGSLELLNNLAVHHAEAGNFDVAERYFLRAQQASTALTDQVLGFTSERQKQAFLATQESGLHAYLTLLGDGTLASPESLRRGLDLWLQRKGLILETQKRAQEALARSQSPVVRQTMASLAALRAEVSAHAFAGPGREGAAAFQRRLRDMERRKEELQASLSAQSQALASAQRRNAADSAQVAAALGAGAALVEIAQIHPYRFGKNDGADCWKEPRYLAFILIPGKSGGIRMVDLGAAGPIDEAIAGYKAAILANEAAELARRSQELFARVFAPLRQRLGPAKRIFVSADGALSLVPFETFRQPGGRYLIEDYTFSYLTSGRDLLAFGTRGEPAGRSLVLGDPDFDLDARGQTEALAAVGVPRSMLAQLRAGLPGLAFERLPSTRAEALAIRDILNPQHTEVYLGSEALEDVLVAARSPKVLHLATHAFFLPTQAASPLGLGGDPLLRSGLVLAGANRALAGEGGAAGVLTAEKVMNLDLRGTELVVLSACSTGAGDVRAGEGVYGLQRAFSQAGARAMVMSMWPVPDEETKELMVRFYENLRRGMDRAQALRGAALDEMKVAARRHGSASPLFWGAFVFLGDPGAESLPSSRPPATGARKAKSRK